MMHYTRKAKQDRHTANTDISSLSAACAHEQRTVVCLLLQALVAVARTSVQMQLVTVVAVVGVVGGGGARRCSGWSS